MMYIGPGSVRPSAPKDEDLITSISCCQFEPNTRKRSICLNRIRFLDYLKHPIVK